MINENPHWSKEKWIVEKDNSIRCLEETKKFIEDNKDIGNQEINTSTLNDFSNAIEQKKILDKLESKKEYVLKLEQKISNIDEILNSTE